MSNWGNTEPTTAQQEVIDHLFNHPFWKKGRGAGKSWLRAHLVDRLIEEDQKEQENYYRKLRETFDYGED